MSYPVLPQNHPFLDGMFHYKPSFFGGNPHDFHGKSREICDVCSQVDQRYPTVARCGTSRGRDRGRKISGNL